MRISRAPLALVTASFLSFIPQQAHACACGCGVFDVGGSNLMPSGQGGTVYLEYDYVNQDRNWNGSSRAPLADNEDKQVRTSFYVAGLQYMFNRSWGVEVQAPYADRHFTTTDEDSGDIVSFDHSDFGDVRVTGIYSGFSSDMSTGLLFGVKLPTGDHDFHGFDRDTAIGTGSTDALLGFYHQGRLTKDNLYGWFIHGIWDQPVLTDGDYHPGTEVNAAVGVYREGWDAGKGFKVAPVLQLIGTTKANDGGDEALPDDTGYNRLMLSPGAEISFGSTKLYGDVAFPIYQDVNGNQLTAPVMFKMIVSYSF